MVDLLIIGKSGQLGSALVKAASDKKLNFEAFSRKEFDIARQKHLAKLAEIKPKIIINTSAYHVVSDCELHPHKAFQINTIAVSNLAKLAKKINAKFVTFSTNYVFDGKKKVPYLEDDRTKPLQMYGLSKLSGEYAALNQYRSGTYIIRSCAVYGNAKLGSRIKKGNCVLTIIREAREKGVVIASKNQFVNPTNASDLAIATLKLLNSRANSGIYHLTNEGACSWYDFTKVVLRTKNIKAKVKKASDDSDINRPIYTVLANTKARKYGVVLPAIEEGVVSYLKEL